MLLVSGSEKCSCQRQDCPAQLTSVPTAAKVRKPPILLKNSVFGEIGEIFARTAQLAFSGEGFGQIGFLSLMCQLTAPHGRSHLTFRYCGFFPKNYDI
jgi:hypothetical protein